MSGWVLVTGAAQRIGRAIALELAAGGWDIIVHYNTSQDEALKTLDHIEALGRKACLAEIDLAHLPQVAGLIPAVTAELGPLAALVNNASIFVPDHMIEDKAAHNTINAEAPRLLSEAFYRQNFSNSPPLEGDDGCGVASKKTKPGSIGKHPPSSSPLKGGRTPVPLVSPVIVNILDADPTGPELSLYNESKKTLRDMTLRMARNFAPSVRVNGVALGPVLRGPRETVEHFQRIVQKTPLGKSVALEAVAATVRFLIEQTAITGAIIPVDSGLHLKT